MLLIPTAVVNQTSSRALESVYQPNLTRPTLVLVTIAFTQAANAAGTTVEMLCDSANPPLTVANVCACSLTATAGQTVYSYVPMTIIVPPSYYYKIHTLSGAGGALNFVAEQTL